MYEVIGLRGHLEEVRIARFDTYEAAAKRISWLSLILPGWRFRIERRVASHPLSHVAH
jgi:hypothetical protein